MKNIKPKYKKGRGAAGLTGKRVLVFTGLLLLLAQAAYAGISFRAEVDKSTVALDDTVTCSIVVSGSDLNDLPQPATPRFDNLTLISNSQSSNITIVNNSASAVYTFDYILRPGRVGPASIGRSNVSFRGTTYYSDPISVTVTKATGKPKAPPKQMMSIFDNLMFGGSGPALVPDPVQVKTSVSRAVAYVNQLLVLDFTFRQRVNLLEPPRYIPPATTGFWSVELPQGKKPGGEQHLKTALFPTLPGDLKIGAASLSYKADPFSAAQTVTTRPISIKVLPLPDAGKPEYFEGSVGKYKMTVAPDKAEIEKGKPLLLVAKIFGEGNIQSVSEPVFEAGPAFRKLSSSSKDEVTKGFDSLSGTKTFEIIVLPLKEGAQELPPLKFDYFDPEAKKYVELVSDRFQINVLPSNLAVSPDGGNVLPKENAGTVKVGFGLWNFLKRNWLALAGMVFLLALLYGLVKLWQGRPRRGQTLKIARKKLKKAKQLLKANKLKASVAEIYQTVADYLGHKFSFAAGGLTTDRLLDALSEKGVSRELRERIEAFTSECDLVRFTPSSLDKKRVAALLSVAEELIGSIRLS